MIEDLKNKLQAEVERLNNDLNFVIPGEIDRARQHGDLQEELRVQGRPRAPAIHHPPASRTCGCAWASCRAFLKKNLPKDRVGFGSRVTVRDAETKHKEIYALTLGDFIEGGEDGDEMPVSMASPLGKALLGGKVGETVAITLPMGKRKLKIVELATVHDIVKE